MSNGILPPDLKPIQQLLSGDTIFAVPPYQRSFAWGKDEIEELWEDLMRAVREGREDYFLGTIVLQRSGQEPHEIIDGQQRLTCISMIFSALRNVLMNKNDPRAYKIHDDFLAVRDYSLRAVPRPKLKLNRINNEMYVRYVVESADYETVTTALKSKGLDPSNRKLLEAYHFFLGKVSLEAAQPAAEFEQFFERLVRCLASAVKLITIPVTSGADAFLIFESLNARGKELALSDLVKNRMYSTAGSEGIDRAQALWEKMEAELQRTSIPEYLRHFWIAKKAELSDLPVREKHLYKAITSHLNDPSQTITLLCDLSDTARDYVAIGDYTLWPDDLHFGLAFQSTLDDLKLFRVTQCYPVLLNAIQLFQDPAKVAKTFRSVANFSFRYNIIGNGNPGSMELIFGRIAHGIRTGIYLSPEAVADELRDTSRDVDFRTQFEQAIFPKSKAKLARYTLAKINNHLQGGEQIANPDSKEVNLEHILPQNPGPDWLAAFSAGVDPTDYVYRLGNLTLLRSKLNADAANKSFKDKQQLAFSKSDLVLNHGLDTLAQWGENEIESRQREMAKVALRVWPL